MKKVNCDILIIGGGPAGLTAGVYSARGGKKTIVIEELVCGGQVTQTQDIENMPGYAFITGPELATEMVKSAEASGVEIVYDRIKSVKFSNGVDSTDKGFHKVVCEDTTYIAKAVIVATGAGPRKMNVDNSEKYDARGIHYCAHCDGAFYKGKDIVVVGTGNSAVEDALYLANVASHVTVVAKYDKFTAQEVLSKRLLEQKNVTVLYKHGVVRVDGDKKLGSITVAALETPTQDPLTVKETKTIECAGVFVAIGRAPSSHLFKDMLEMNKVGYIKVNDKMQTNVEGVFAAGDICEKQLRQIVTACSDGAIAALNASIHVKRVK